MKYEHNKYILSTGREFYANDGLLSVDQDGNMAEGFDGNVEIEGRHIFNYDKDEHDPENAFTQAERREIADYMIALWNKWAAKDE